MKKVIGAIILASCIITAGIDACVTLDIKKGTYTIDQWGMVGN